MRKITYYSAFLMLLLVNSFSIQAQVSSVRGDVNQDGNVNITDVTSLIDYLLSGEWSDELNDDHEWVDLGLPSGTLWATCNVGANSPEEFGSYFAWGETIPKEVYSWETYKWCNGSNTTLTKYCNFSSYGLYGFVDYMTELDLEDDAAYVNWGSAWRMATYIQLKELEINCTWTWSTHNGVNGQLLTGPNGNTMFLPAAGSRWDDSLYDVGLCGYYWSRTLNTSSGPDNAFHLYFDSDFISWLYYRLSGHTVRAVRVSQN